MSLLIKNAKILIPNSSYNGHVVDILIEKGKLKSIDKNINVKAKQIIESEELCVSLGWLDIGTHTGEPGFEHRETLESLEKAAIAGGYTGLVVMPNTQPFIQSKSDLQYFKNNSESKSIDYFPTGTASKDCKGDELTEYMDLSKSGAIGFTDGELSIQDEGFMMRALQYAKATNNPIINMPSSASMSKGAHMHEGEVSTRMGLKGTPSIAESLMLQRDIVLTDYCDSSTISHKISTLESCSLIKSAKKKSINVSATVSCNNLVFTDEDVRGFKANLKLSPPLRLRADQKSLIKAVNDDTIDAIVSDHQPVEIELKKLEFSYASKGAIGLQTCFASVWTKCSEKIELTKIIEKLSIGPRNIMGIPIPKFEIGSEVNITIFDPTVQWKLEENAVFSKSKNSPWLLKELKGKVLGIYNNGKFESNN